MLLAGYGATEFGALSRFIKKEGDEKDWEYMDFTSDVMTIRWDPQGDGTYEFQILVRSSSDFDFDYSDLR